MLMTTHIVSYTNNTQSRCSVWLAASLQHTWLSQHAKHIVKRTRHGVSTSTKKQMNRMHKNAHAPPAQASRKRSDQSCSDSRSRESRQQRRRGKRRVRWHKAPWPHQESTCCWACRFLRQHSDARAKWCIVRIRCMLFVLLMLARVHKHDERVLITPAVVFFCFSLTL